ncbi:TPA: efflux RND transporter periplasmic adaptor subunit [Providencia alcalifaciens]|uniref:Efflux RND transporter periplasmic adaptor subunit n=3 Tax=Providencia alcalifaciens TaxID=126385 RepID=A0AAW9V834_9GAMM|nr:MULTISPECIES: efflux RND transporter periplasmic adaptor subunit [Providencia]ATG16487.1 MexE family multidrug efflux RND transporter periplasmic adaptor subunit [Providencia alcalifaciens]EEB45545.1 acriflavine resistance protein A [Providencia alcalifaciens DSM 30120]EKT67393.1 Acriflavin resistance protein A [Providencia alcalifaciens Dmel2]ETT07175.1 acriflavine resistance protein A [Providencia alcalifaciens F90-2004]EUC96407.1 acriflavine resistance protein A [Providencia alcalifacien
MRKNRGVLPLALLVLSGGLALSGCNEEQKGGGERPAPDVGIVTLKAEPLTIKTELPGRTSAYRVAEVRPQVSGIILKRNYKEGSDVEAGVSLYQIDPAPFQATYNSAKAELAKAQANANLAALTVKRYKPLLGTNYISQQEYDQANSTYAQSLAAVKAAEAAVETARINLNYTKVTSPISGRTGKSNVTEGALVSAGQTTELMRVQQLDPIYVDVTQSSEDFLRLKNEIEQGALQKEPGKAPVSLVINGGQEYAQKGQLEFSDVTVDETTGSITMRAVFPNPNKELMPGMFVRAILEDGVKENAILVPQQGVARTPQGDAQVMVVGAENKVEVRKVKAAQAIGNNWLVTDGVKDGDRVIVIGLQKIKPGMVVVPKQANLETQSIVDTQAKPETASK